MHSFHSAGWLSASPSPHHITGVKEEGRGFNASYVNCYHTECITIYKGIRHSYSIGFKIASKL
jgi:hypothetical protein